MQSHSVFGLYMCAGITAIQSVVPCTDSQTLTQVVCATITMAATYLTSVINPVLLPPFTYLFEMTFPSMGVMGLSRGVMTLGTPVHFCHLGIIVHLFLLKPKPKAVLLCSKHIFYIGKAKMLRHFKKMYIKICEHHVWGSHLR